LERKEEGFMFVCIEKKRYLLEERKLFENNGKPDV